MRGWTLVALLALPLFSSADESPQSLLETTTSQADLKLLDPELADAIPKLVLPPQEPPARVRLPQLVVRGNEWRGVQCGVTEPRFAVFKHADKWEAFWTRAMAPMSPRLAKVPTVDFGQDMVVGVFMGERRYPYFEIEIKSIKEEARPGLGKILVVRYREITRMIGVFVPPFAVQPFHLRKIPVFSGEIVFEKVKR